jgi:hypothetical protein
MTNNLNMTNEENLGGGRGNAPQSMQNLKPYYSTERARAMQKKSVEARMKNKELREAMSLTVKEWKVMGTDILNELPPAIDIIKLRMIQHMQADELDEAVELAKTLAEYEQPKLQRIDGITGSFDANGMSDEELEAKLIELENDK